MISKLKFFFGDRHNLQDTGDLNFQKQEKLLEIPLLKKLKKDWLIKNFIRLNQTHSDIGHIINTNNLAKYISEFHEGDYLITNLTNTALGVYTGDCLAIIFYDPINNAIGICHAGWKGSISQIAIKTFKSMQENFNTQAKDCLVIFSPSAKKCCYSVDLDFKKNLENFVSIDQIFFKQDNKYYFDLPEFNKLQLLSIGIKQENINLQNNICTICNLEFCSYRRHKNKERQLNIVNLTD